MKNQLISLLTMCVVSNIGLQAAAVEQQSYSFACDGKPAPAPSQPSQAGQAAAQPALQDRSPSAVQPAVTASLSIGGIKESAASGEGVARLYNFGQKFYGEGEYTRAFECLAEVDLVHLTPGEKANVQRMLGTMYYYGRGVEQDDKKAYDFLKPIVQAQLSPAIKSDVENMVYMLQEKFRMLQEKFERPAQRVAEKAEQPSLSPLSFALPAICFWVAVNVVKAIRASASN